MSSSEPPLRLVADTSVLIEPPARAEAEAHGLADAVWAISAMSIAELHKGSLTAANDDQRAARLRRLAATEALYDALPFDADAARILGRQMAKAKRERQGMRVRDAIIAATAEANELTILTRDSDFQRFGAAVIVLAGSG